MIKIWMLGLFGIFFLKSNIVTAQAPAIQWQKAYGGSAKDEMQNGTKSIKTLDGGFIMVGYTESSDGNVTGSHSDRDFWIVKTDANGIIQWEKTYGGSNKDYARSVDLTSDGGYIVAGVSESNDRDITGNHGGADMWVIKLNAAGILQWQKTYGGTANDFANSVHQSPDGGYIIFGTTGTVNNGDVTGFHGGTDFWAVKTDPSGNIQWQKTYGGTDTEEGEAIQLTSDGGYILSGFTLSNNGDVNFNHGSADFWIVKTDGGGNLLWEKSYGGSGDDVALDIKQTNEGGYIIVGYTFSADGDITLKQAGTDCWVVKTGNSGNIQWQKTYGGNSEDYAFSVQQTAEGGYVVSGYTLSDAGDVSGYHGGSDGWVIKLANTGLLVWQKALGGSANEILYGAQQTPDGGYIVSGTTQSNDGDVTNNHGASDFWLVKLAPNCNLAISAGSDETLYFGYGPQQCKTKTALISGGMGPFTYSWTLDRPLLVDESMSGTGSNTVNFCLLDTALLCVKVTDALGCNATDCAVVFAEDVRCFAGDKKNKKITVCHNQKIICIDSSAVQSHLNHGDQLGYCSALARSLNNNVIEEKAPPKMMVSSNTGENRIMVKLNLSLSEKNGIIQLINLNGQLLKTIPVSGAGNYEFLTNTKGIYIVHYKSGKENIQRRVLVN